MDTLPPRHVSLKVRALTCLSEFVHDHCITKLHLIVFIYASLWIQLRNLWLPTTFASSLAISQCDLYCIDSVTAMHGEAMKDSVLRPSHHNFK